MPPVLDPRSFCRRFRFSGTDCLYRDHYGRRVLAEAEGSGRYRVLSSEMPILVEVDEVLGGSESGSFGSSIVVLSQEEGACDVVLANTPESITGTGFEGRISGCGWLLASQGPVVVDGLRRLCGPPVPGFPIPFFESVVADGRLEVVLSGGHCELIDRFSIGDAAALKEREFRVQNISKVSVLDSAFEDGTLLSAPVASHLNVAVWRVAIPASNAGLILRKTYDAFHGRQRARVFVDGVLAGWWYEPEQNRGHRWRVGQFGIGRELVDGRASVEIAIDPPAGAPLWSVGEIELLALFD